MRVSKRSKMRLISNYKISIQKIEIRHGRVSLFPFLYFHLVPFEDSLKTADPILPVISLVLILPDFQTLWTSIMHQTAVIWKIMILITLAYCIHTKAMFCLFVLRLNVPVNNFSVMSGRSHRFLGN